MTIMFQMSITHMRRTMSTIRIVQAMLVISLLGVVVTQLSGCNILGPIIVATAPEPTVPAQYELEDRPTLVFVDDRDGLLVPAGLADVIADRASEQLINEKIITKAIRPRDATAVAKTNDRANNLMPIDKIGETVGAEQVIYVEIASLSESMANDQLTPVATARVKVLDIVAKKRLFPAEGAASYDYHTVNAKIQPVDEEMYRTASTRRKVRETMALQLGDDIAKLFYEHLAPDRLGERLGGR